MRIFKAILFFPLLLLGFWVLLFAAEGFRLSAFVIPHAKAGLYEKWVVEAEIDKARPVEKIPFVVFWLPPSETKCAQQDNIQCSGYFDVDAYKFVDEVYWRVIGAGEPLFVQISEVCALKPDCLKDVVAGNVWPPEAHVTTEDPRKATTYGKTCVTDNVGFYDVEYCKHWSKLDKQYVSLSYHVKIEGVKFFPFHSEHMYLMGAVVSDFSNGTVNFLNMPKPTNSQ